MHLKKLEIIGFKSFANKTILHFEPGVTAVVGPNGCGKSNIFDSIRWVLGEQAPKALRGTKMEDVIFSGTDKKEPINFAEVSLTFNNETKFLPIDYNEVTVTRRLYRSGESEYLLNRTNVRLKDIQELFMGTGVGADSYSFIQQGKIDLILSSRPEDRRAVFDEASGITKYKAKKRETMRRLEDVEANLLRVNDIVLEVKRQIGSVERQADKARKYREKFEELKDLEIKSGVIQLKELQSEISMLEKQQQDSSSEQNLLTNKIQELSQNLKDKEEKLLMLNSKIENMTTEKLNTFNAIERDSEYIKLDHERINEIDRRQKEIDGSISHLNERISSQEENFSRQKQVVDNLSNNRGQKEEELKAKESHLECLDQGIKEAQKRIREAKELILEINATQINLRNELSDTSARISSNSSRKHRLEVEFNKVSEEKNNQESKLIGVNAQCHELELQLKMREDEFSSLKFKVDNLEISRNDLLSEINELEKEKIAKESQLQFLEDLQLRYKELPSSNGILTIEGDIPQDIELILAKIKSPVDISDINASIKAKLNCQNEVNSVICESRFITINAEQLKERIAEIEGIIHSNQNKVDHLKEELVSLKNELPQKEKEVKEANIAFANKQSEKQSLEDDCKRLSEEASLVSLEISEVEEEVNDLKQRQESAKIRLEELKAQEEENNNSIIENQKIIEDNSALREECLITVTQIKTEIDSWSSREKSEIETLRLIEESLYEDRKTLEQRSRELQASKERKEQLENEIARLDTETVDLKHKLQLIEDNINEESQRKGEINSAISEIHTTIETQKENLENLRNGARDIQLKVQDKNYKIQSLKERMQQAYKVEIENAQVQDLDQINIEELKDNIETLKSRVESFGNVNLVAIEEYDDLKTRYEFLTKQQEDLIQAKESLLKAIAKINRTTRKLFLETFEKVSAEFKNYFRMLFGGGEANLILMDEQDVLESGIEIICRPPGKKLQNVLLLSGGEKSLAAIALIFAVFKVKPSPFCVLDEIDAALDESNVGRFSRMVQEFAQTSQFIIVTHNKKTITSASIMYGITMAESGISKIVSVKLHDNDDKQGAEDEPKVQPVAA